MKNIKTYNVADVSTRNHKIILYEPQEPLPNIVWNFS